MSNDTMNAPNSPEKKKKKRKRQEREQKENPKDIMFPDGVGDDGVALENSINGDDGEHSPKEKKKRRKNKEKGGRVTEGEKDNNDKSVAGGEKSLAGDDREERGEKTKEDKKKQKREKKKQKRVVEEDDGEEAIGSSTQSSPAATTSQVTTSPTVASGNSKGGNENDEEENKKENKKKRKKDQEENVLESNENEERKKEKKKLRLEEEEQGDVGKKSRKENEDESGQANKKHKKSTAIDGIPSREGTEENEVTPASTPSEDSSSQPNNVPTTPTPSSSSSSNPPSTSESHPSTTRKPFPSSTPTSRSFSGAQDEDDDGEDDDDEGEEEDEKDEEEDDDDEDELEDKDEGSDDGENSDPEALLRALTNPNTRISKEMKISKARSSKDSVSISKVGSKLKSSSTKGTSKDTSWMDGMDPVDILTTKQLRTCDLEALRAKGIPFRQGRWTNAECNTVRSAVKSYAKRKKLSDEDLLSFLLRQDRTKTKDAEHDGFWIEIASSLGRDDDVIVDSDGDSDGEGKRKRKGKGKQKDIVSTAKLRPLVSVIQWVQRNYHPLARQGKWTPEEDLELETAVRKHGEGNWKAISDEVGRRGEDCKDRWRNHVKRKSKGVAKEGKWETDEKNELRKIVMEMKKEKRQEKGGGDSDSDTSETGLSWLSVSEKMGGGRGPSQCRNTWMQVVSKTTSWGRKHNRCLLEKLEALDVADSSEVPWKELVSGDLAPFHPHELTNRWRKFKMRAEGLKGETMDFRDILKCLRENPVLLRKCSMSSKPS